MLSDLKLIEKTLSDATAALRLLEREWIRICIDPNDPVFNITATGLDQIGQAQRDLLSVEHSLLTIKGELILGRGDQK